MDDDDEDLSEEARRRLANACAAFATGLRPLVSACTLLAITAREIADAERERRGIPTASREVAEAAIARAMRTPPSEG